MIKSLTATNFLGESVTVVLTEDDPDHGLIIYEMEGLGAPKANINTTELATMDGSLFNSARAEERNITIQFLFTFAPRIEDSRQRTYKYFPIKREVQLKIETDNRTSVIKGYVESNEPDIFSDQETNQISIICSDPFFRADYTESLVFSGIEPMFEFEFSNESLSDDLLEMGSIEHQTERMVYYSGDADVGVTIYIHALGEARNITIYNVRSREFMRIDTTRLAQLTGQGIIAGDDIIINTTRDNKGIKLLRNGHYTNILNCLDRGTDWFRLTKGPNIFAYIADYGEENLYFSIENEILYEGV